MGWTISSNNINYGPSQGQIALRGQLRLQKAVHVGTCFD